MYKWIIILVCLILVVGFFYAFLDKEIDEQCDREFGNTAIRLKVLDINRKEIIDSVRLTVRYGASMDKFIDSVFEQQEGLVYNFIIPETYYDCETFWFEVSNPLYWEEIYFADTSRDFRIKKGRINESTLYLKPATKVRVTLENGLEKFNGDTVYLHFDRKDDKDVNAWDLFSEENFKGRKRTSEFFSLESDVQYRAIWIHKDNELLDTTFYEFNTKPFDTLDLKFTLKKRTPNKMFMQ